MALCREAADFRYVEGALTGAVLVQTFRTRA